ncbi:MAG: 2'-5' RNA ligase family protein [Actinobacteria bacterium]|nr:2'-5' RNA ligase family protein [Actinomycetota bacterium]
MAGVGGDRTALVVVVDDAEPVAGAFRRRHLRETVGRGLPLHITVLFPFVPLALVDEEVLRLATASFAAVPAFEASLTAVGAFERHVWLAPEPDERFQALIAAARAAFPAYPLYGDPSHDPVPHATIGEADDATALARAAEQELGPGLPVAFAVSAVTMLTEGEEGLWRRHATFALGPPHDSGC